MPCVKYGSGGYRECFVCVWVCEGVCMSVHECAWVCMSVCDVCVTCKRESWDGKYMGS